jgi:hypothetical protein
MLNAGSRYEVNLLRTNYVEFLSSLSSEPMVFGEASSYERLP